MLVEPAHAEISIRRQCELLGVCRASWYYQPVGESEENLRLMRLIDEQYTRVPFYGTRKMRAWLRSQGYEVNRKRVSRLMDWFSRFVLSWALSVSLELDFCLEALKSALRRGRPEIFNSDQGPQFTSDQFTGELEGRRIAVSMDGRGRCLDNIFIERLWRSLKYEEVYWKDYGLVSEAREGIRRYFRFYNHERVHASLDYPTPASVYLARG